MDRSIRGLNCAACQTEIQSAGVTCPACSATHHERCYRTKQHCVSCQCAKEAIPFAIMHGELPRPSRLWPLALVAISLPCLIAQYRQLPPCPVQPAVQRVVATTVLTVPAAPAPAKRVQIQVVPYAKKTACFTRMPRVARFPGRTVVTLLRCNDINTVIPVDLEGYPTRTLLIQVHPRGSQPRPAVVELKVSAGGLTKVISAYCGSYGGLIPVRLDKAVTKAVIEIASGLHTVDHVTGLDDTPPPGTAVDAQKVFTVTQADDKILTLTDQQGGSYRIPRQMVSTEPLWDAISLSSPKSGQLLMISRDGQPYFLSGNALHHLSRGTFHSDFNFVIRHQAPGPDASWPNEIGAWSALKSWPLMRRLATTTNSTIGVTFDLVSDGTVRMSGSNENMQIPCSLETMGTLARWLDPAKETCKYPNTSYFHMPAGFHSWPGGSRYTRGGAPERTLARFITETALPLFRKTLEDSGRSDNVIRVGSFVTLSLSKSPKYHMEPTLQVMMLPETGPITVRLVPVASRWNQPALDVELPRSFLSAYPGWNPSQNFTLSRGRPADLLP